MMNIYLVSQLYSSLLIADIINLELKFYLNHTFIDNEGFKVNIIDYEGYNSNAEDKANYLKLLTKDLYSRHKRYLKLK